MHDEQQYDPNEAEKVQGESTAPDPAVPDEAYADQAAATPGQPTPAPDTTPPSAHHVPEGTPAPDAQTFEGEPPHTEPFDAVADDDDVAPDANEPGDQETPNELSAQQQDQPAEPDQVDQEG